MLVMILWFGDDMVNINRIMSFILYLVCVYPVDDEKLDERAKLSVAAKRSLFRVSFTCVYSTNKFF